MFNKALFRQSSKSNLSRWLAITISTCVMLFVIILVLGNLGGFGGVKSSLTNIFTQANEQATIKTSTVDGYELYLTSLDTKHSLVGLANGNQSLGEDKDDFKTVWNTMMDNYKWELENFVDDNDRQPTAEEKDAIRKNLAPMLIDEYKSLGVDVEKLGFKESTLENMLVYIMQATGENFVKFENDEAKFFTDARTIITDAIEIAAYKTSYNEVIGREGATETFAVHTAEKMQTMVAYAMSSYGGDGSDAGYNKADHYEVAKQYVVDMTYQLSADIVPTEYNADETKQFRVSVKIIAENSINAYQTWIEEGYSKQDAKEQVTISISDQIPESVQRALNELGSLDVGGLIVGSMFFKMAGLLLPLVFVMTTANGLLAGQVDSGSMAYVLSTPTKRKTVTITQMIYLVVSLVLMFVLLTVTSEIALVIVGGRGFGINYHELFMLNIGAFLASFAFAGFCFMCSAVFNRSKHSIGLGGGFTIFSLVCTILGLFGSNVIPSIMRIRAMNVFNYLSIISLFDTSSILSGGHDFIWKGAILFVLGVIFFITGIVKFDKKDLPL